MPLRMRDFALTPKPNCRFRLNRGVSVPETAERIGVTENRMCAMVKEILARRIRAALEDFAALQASRPNKSLMVARGAMSAENLNPVALVVRIIRELGRFVAERRRRCDPRPADAEVQQTLAFAGDGRIAAPQAPASEHEQATILAPATNVEAPGAPLDTCPEMAPQALEIMEYAPEKYAVPAVLDEAVQARKGARNEVGAARTDEAFASPLAASPAPAPAPAGQQERIAQGPRTARDPAQPNGSENDIRCQVTKRKISGGTRSNPGRDCRDAFLGLNKTCDKLAIAFWDYLGARLAVPGCNDIPALAEIVSARAPRPP